MLKGLRVQNFKSLKEIDVDLAPLTVIAGKNNSGKSSFIESILFASEASENASGISQVRIPNHISYNWNDPELILHKDGSRQRDSLEINLKIELDDDAIEERIWNKLERFGIENYQSNDFWMGAEIGDKNLVPKYSIALPDNEFELVRPSDDRADDVVIPPINRNVSYSTNRFLNHGVNLDGNDVQPLSDSLLNLENIATNMLENVYFISNERKVTDWEADPRGHDFVGVKGENVVSLLHRLRDERDVFDEIVSTISEMAPDIHKNSQTGPTTGGLYADLDDQGNTQTELRDADTEERFNIQQSGEGFRRALPIITQLSIASPGDIVIIEDPEIGIYPSTLEIVTQHIVNAVSNNNIQVILSTHSVHVPNKIGQQCDEEMVQGLRFVKDGGSSRVEPRSMEDLIPTDFWYNRQSNQDG